MWANVKTCEKAPELTLATQRRLLADLRRLQEEPIPLAAAQPCSDEDFTLWDGVVGVDMEVTHFGDVTVPLHFLIDFPFDYPRSAPNIGFSFEFEYRGGAQYMMPNGRLKGKKVICLDVLGNFGSYHQEWKKSVGSGWSPAYTVTTLLVQLQSVLCDLGKQMSQRERDITYQSAVRFCETNSKAVLQLLDEEDIREQREHRQKVGRIAKLCAGDSLLFDRIEDFADKAGLSNKPNQFEELMGLLTHFASLHAHESSGNAAIVGDIVVGGCAGSNDPETDLNICCFSTGKLYTQAMLGVGVSRERRNLGTAAELLSKDAFDAGLRQNTDKSPFEFFLPVWINQTHAGNNAEWQEALKSSYLEIGGKVFEAASEDEAILEVFPRLINQMIVEVMRPDAAKCAAIATFEAMCNFWRTLRWLVDKRPSLRERISSMLSKFILNESGRHKDNTPDLGMILVVFTVFQGHRGCPSRESFIQAYADENSIRWVMWWQRSGVRPEPVSVFQATQVSREIFMFQMMVVDIIISDVAETLKDMEATNCKLPERLERLQLEWRERKASTTSWVAYYRNIGVAPPSFASDTAWIVDCVSRAAAKGPKYGGAKGEDKGAAKGNHGKAGGKGKGGSKNGRY